MVIVSVSLSEDDYNYIKELNENGYGTSAIMKNTLNILRNINYIDKIKKINDELAELLRRYSKDGRRK